MICKTHIRGKAGEANVHARLFGVTPGIGQANRAESGDGGFQKDDIDVVVMFRFAVRAESSEGATLHFQINDHKSRSFGRGASGNSPIQ